MRGSRSLLCVLVALILVAPAYASGPVFVVVPTTAAEARESAPTPLSATVGGSELERELRADHLALAHARLRASSMRAAMARALRATASSRSLSDWLEAEKRSIPLRQAEESAATRRDRLQKEIAALEKEAHPVLAPGVDLTMSMFGAPLGVEAVSIAEQYLACPIGGVGRPPGASTAPG